MEVSEVSVAEVKEVAGQKVYEASKDNKPPLRGKFVQRLDGRVFFSDANGGATDIRHRDLNQDPDDPHVINAGQVASKGDTWILFGTSGELKDAKGRELVRMRPDEKTVMNKETAERLNEIYGAGTFTVLEQK